MSYELESCGLCVQDPSLGTPRRFSRSPPPSEAEATNASSYTVFFWGRDAPLLLSIWYAGVVVVVLFAYGRKRRDMGEQRLSSP